MVYLLTYMHLWNQPNVAKWTIHGWYAQCYVYSWPLFWHIHFTNENYGAVVLLPLRDGRDGPKKWTNHHLLASQDAKTPSTWWKSGWVFRVQKYGYGNYSELMQLVYYICSISSQMVFLDLVYLLIYGKCSVNGRYAYHTWSLWVYNLWTPTTMKNEGCGFPWSPGSRALGDDQGETRHPQMGWWLWFGKGNPARFQGNLWDLFGFQEFHQLEISKGKTLAVHQPTCLVKLLCHLVGSSALFWGGYG